MKLVLVLTTVLCLAGCASSGDEFVQEALPNANTNPITGQPQPPQPDPVITEPIDSSYLGIIKASATGAGQNISYDYDGRFEYREKQAGNLIGYSRMWDRQQNGKLIIDYWSTGQRTDANMIINLNLNPACPDVKLAGKLDAKGNIIFPKTTQKLRCGIFVTITLITEATIFTKQSATAWDFWDYIENHFASK
jgi:threonine aldolase